MKFTDKKDFFKDFYVEVEQNCSDEELKNFANLDTDEARFKFVQQLPSVQKLDVTCGHNGGTKKNADIAIELRKLGNNAFQNKNWPVALDFYNKCQLITPAENGM